MGNDDLIIDLPIDDIDAGEDEFGTPVVVPKGAAAAKTEKDAPREKAASRNDDGLVAALKKERDEVAAIAATERAARIQAERVAAERTRDATVLGNYASNTEYQMIAGAIKATQSEADAAEREYVRAQEAGDFNTAAKAQRVMARAESDLSRLMDGKAEIESRVRQQQQKPAEPVQKVDEAVRANVDPVEDYIGKFPKASQDWLNSHREFVTDPKMNHKMIAAAHEAQAEGIKPHSAEFIDFLDRKFGFADGDAEEIVETKPADRGTDEKPKARTMPSAPVSRKGSYFSSSNMNADKIRLSPYLANAAREMGSDPAVYAKNIVKAIKDGKLPKNYLDPDYPHGA